MSKEVKKILLAEDDPNFGMVLQSYLEVKKFNVTLCKDGKDAYKAFNQEVFDLCIFDVMMPNKDGFTLAKEINFYNKNIPFIFLTARSMKEDKIKGYNLGAIDYLVKPFDPEILYLKIQAILDRENNRETSKVSKYIHLGSLILDTDKQLLILDKEQINLTYKETALLQLLHESIDGVLLRKDALTKIWREDNYFTAKSMDVYLTKLRKLLKKDPIYNIQILNIRGKGFHFKIEKKS